MPKTKQSVSFLMKSELNFIFIPNLYLYFVYAKETKQTFCLVTFVRENENRLNSILSILHDLFSFEIFSDLVDEDN